MVGSKVVCVTGANGFIASWVVKLLLERGYTVKASVRSYEKSKRLLQLPGASERLHLIEADLLKPGEFDPVVEGCDGVFHTASPIPDLVTPGYTIKDPDAEFLDPAAKGTLNVLESCAKKRPKRIVLTSSVVAQVFTPKLAEVSVADESLWSDIDYLRKNKEWYALSKTLAELAAWDFVKEHDLDMVTVLPGYVFGPPLQGYVNATVELLASYINGSQKTYPNETACYVGVRDVALSHILAYEKPEAEGRFCCIERVSNFENLCSTLRKLYPQYPVPDKMGGDGPAQPLFKSSNEKLKKLGIKFQPWEEYLQETVETLQEINYLE